MIRILCFLSLLSVGIPAAAQSHSSPEIPVDSGTAVPAPSPEAADTALADRPLVERAVGGALVGAVTGAALGAEDAACAPDEPASAAITGGFLGAIRAVFGLRPSRLPPNAGDGGVEGPYPFDGRTCEQSP